MAVVGQLVVELISDASKYEKGLDDAQSKTGGWASRVGGIAGNALKVGLAGAAVGAAVAIGAVGAAAFDVSNQTREATNQMVASLGFTEDKASQLAGVAKSVFGNNFAGSVMEAAGTVELLAKQIQGLADDPAGMQRATENAYRLQDVFEADIPGSIDAVDTLMENFGLTSDEAFDLLAAGYQNGLDRSGDLLDTIGEYSNQFAEGGASAQEFFGFLSSGLQGGVLGTDKAADAFKEFRLRINDGSDATAEALDMLEGVVDSGILKGLSNGSVTAADAFEKVVAGLNTIEDPAVRMQTATALLGTQFEDLGDSAALGLTMTGDSFTNIEGTIDSLDIKYKSFGAFATGMWRRIAVAASPITDKLLELANDSVPYLEAAFTSFETNALPVIESVTNAISNLSSFLSGLFSGDELSTGITGNIAFLDTFKVWFDENLPLIQETVELVLSYINAFWEEHGQSIMTIVNTYMENISLVIDTVLQTVLDLITLVLQIINGDWEAAGETLTGIVTRIWETIVQVVSSQITVLTTAVQVMASGLISIISGIGTGMFNAGASIVTNLQDGIASKWEFLTGWFKNKLTDLTDLLPFSPPRDTSSPLTRLPKSGEGIVEQIQSGMDRTRLNLDTISPNFNLPISGLDFASSSNTGQPINISVSNVFNGNADEETVRRGIDNGLSQSLRQAGLS